MKVKTIFCAKYDGPWRVSSLDYESEIRHARKALKHKNLSTKEVEEIYLMYRNAAGGVNSYKIEEVEVPNPEVCLEKYALTDYENWGYYIHAAASKFCHKYDEWPVILTANSETLDRLKKQIASEIQVTDPLHYELTHFFCPEFDIHFCLDSSLKTDRFNLIFSKEAVTLSNWRKLLELEALIAQTKDFGKLETPAGALPYWVPAEVVPRFMNAVYGLNLIVDFDWPNWSEGMELLEENGDWESLDLGTLQKLLTVMIRRDRFADGSLIQAFQSKQIQKLLTLVKKKTEAFPATPLE